ncbi:MAG: GIY-YIG nuclease family protein [bacterium]|nr:GIY-YIG nuclease family protein [bacterium]
MFYTYILRNQNGRHYIGHTQDLKQRLLLHNSGDVKSTKKPWSLGNNLLQHLSNTISSNAVRKRN